MPPLSEATRVSHSPSASTQDTKVYIGAVDTDWVIGAVPHGGYVLALVVAAAVEHQAASAHRDPIHVTAHFLRTAAVAPFEVRVRTVKTGRAFSNLALELVQNGTTRVTAHIICGVLAGPPAPGTPALTIGPASPYARRVPLPTHPARAHAGRVPPIWDFARHVRWAQDAVLLARNAPDAPERTHAGSVGGGGVEWGAWMELRDAAPLGAPALAFLVDIFRNLPQLGPPTQTGTPEERAFVAHSWAATLTLTLEFKFPIPPPSSVHSPRTVGIYSTGKFMNDPQGRHEAYVEIWTAPTDIGEGDEVDGWREHQVCLAIATQMAVTLSRDVNYKMKNREAETSKL